MAGHHRQRTQLAPARIRLDLPEPDNSLPVFGDKEVLPVDVERIEMLSPDHRLDNRLLAGPGRADVDVIDTADGACYNQSVIPNQTNGDREKNSCP